MPEPDFDVVFASSDEERRAAQALRYEVFVRELGGDGALVDHDKALEQDRFDVFSRHLLLLDLERGKTVCEQVVGVYRLLDLSGAQRAGGFYSAAEFDLTPITSSGLRLLELGRSCLHAEYRGGMAMYHLWSALAAYVFREKIDVLFGVASFQGTDVRTFSAPLTLLHERHLAPAQLCPSAREPRVCLDQMPYHALDHKAAMTQMPSLIKAYLRLGGGVGEGAYVDKAFNTTDVCLVLDVSQISEKQRKLYTQGRWR